MKNWDDSYNDSQNKFTTNLGKESFHMHLMDFLDDNPKMGLLLRKNKIKGGSSLKFQQFIKNNENNPLIKRYAINLIEKLAIWIDPMFYSVMPVIYPYSVRERTTSQERIKGIKDNWGAANNNGFVIDDNSLIKDFVRNYPVINGLYYNKLKPSKGFIACHIWGNTTTNHKLFSFIPNLCWLPSPIARLSDDESTHISKSLKLISYNLYHNFEIESPKMNNIVKEIWSFLNVDKKEFTNLTKYNIIYSKLCFSLQPLRKKNKLILDIRKILSYIDSLIKNPTIKFHNKEKLLHKRYLPSLSILIKSKPNTITGYKKWLEEYLEALEDNFSINTQSKLIDLQILNQSKN